MKKWKLTFLLLIISNLGWGQIESIVQRQTQTIGELDIALSVNELHIANNLFIDFVNQHDTIAEKTAEFTNSFFNAFLGISSAVDSLSNRIDYWSKTLTSNSRHMQMIYSDIFSQKADEDALRNFENYLRWYKFYLNRLNESLLLADHSVTNDIPTYLSIKSAKPIFDSGETKNSLNITIENIGKSVLEGSNAKLVILGFGDVHFEVDSIDIPKLNSREIWSMSLPFEVSYRGNESGTLLSFIGVNGQEQYIEYDEDPTFRRQYHTLKPGWNLISFYIDPDFPETATILENIRNNVLQIKDEQRSYDPSLPGFLNTLTQLETGKGYWVNVAEGTQLFTDGSILTSDNNTIQLFKGWNLVAFPKEEPQMVREALASILDKTEEIKNTSAAFNPALPDFLNTLSELIPGEGYWIRVSEDCLLNF